jgi:hypothetical protein
MDIARMRSDEKEDSMSVWSPDELARIGRAEELDLSSQRRDGSLRDSVTMWVVRDGDDLYVRSIHGRAGAWFRGTQSRRQGHIRSGGVDRDVSFVIDTDPALNDRVDAAYRDKYRRYGDRIVGSVVNAASRDSTIKLVPR